MIALKKLYGNELLRLALVLSLLKVDPNAYLETETQQLLTGLHIANGSDWDLEQEAQTLFRPRYVHPKSLDNILINYERQIFEEINTLGRYVNTDNARMFTNNVLHTYLVNNVATDTVAPLLAPVAVAEDQEDGVSADDNVGQEVKVEDNQEETEEIEQEIKENNQKETEETEQEIREEQTVEVENTVEIETEGDVSSEETNETATIRTEDIPTVITLSADFLENHTIADIFDEIPTRSFDVNELLVTPNNMQIKKEPQDSTESELDIELKKEINDDLYSDNAMDDFVPYFAAKSEKFLEEPTSIFSQSMADLEEYGELFEDAKDLKDLEYLDGKQPQEDLEKYLMENTPLDSEVYELAPMFEEELVLDVKRERASTSFTSASSSGVSEMDVSVRDVKSEPDEQTGDDLTEEDMNLIEVLWKQDVDMGYCFEDPLMGAPAATKVGYGEELGKELEHQQEKKKEEIEKVKASLLDDVKDDPWAGLNYTVDTETGEYVLQGALPELVNEESRFDLLEEALQLVELGDTPGPDDEPSVEVASGDEMLHPAMRHVPHHPLAHYHNQSLMRSMSVEQRWQDLASLLTIPPPPVPDQYQHYHQHNMSAHGAAGYTPNYHHGPHGPLQHYPEKHPDAYPGSAAPLEGPYKMESAHHPQQHDGLYYQNATTEMAAPPPNQDGFLQSILNDEDLQLMDMAMNEGMYTMRMLDSASGPHHPHHNHSQMMVTERDSASDSAVSSMGSERVPSLSDGEWCDGSDSAQEYHSSKFRPYDSSYGRDRSAHQPQKKHHMFGKRCLQEQQQPTLEPLVPRAPPVVKYECPEQAYHHDPMHLQSVEYTARAQVAPHPTIQPTVDLNSAHSSHALLQPTIQSPPRYGYLDARSARHIQHNHTYSGVVEHRPPLRDKRVRRLTDGSVSDGGSSATSGHLTRDEKRAKALGIPLEVQDIINLPMDEFNERLSKHDLSEAQLSLIRDIRRRGKNKVAAQNCRKRKLDQITSLADEVRAARDRRQRVQREHRTLTAERARAKERFAALYAHVFQNLRDPEGRPLSSSQYSLQQAADGSVVLVPKVNPHDHPMNRTDDDMDRKQQ